MKGATDAGKEFLQRRINAITECLTGPERNRIIRAENGPPMIKRERITAGIFGPKSKDEKGEKRYVYL